MRRCYSLSGAGAAVFGGDAITTFFFEPKGRGGLRYGEFFFATLYMYAKDLAAYAAYD